MRRSAFAGVVAVILAATANAETHTVTVAPGGQLSFSPANITIQLGDTVKWVFAGAGHTTTRSDSPEMWDSGSAPIAGFEFTHTFTTVGVFPYVCTPHSSIMMGSVTVEGKTNTTTAVTSSLNPSTVGDSVTFTATVTPASGSGTPDGTASFFDGESVLCPPITLISASAQCTTASLTPGAHSITAVYSGSAIFNGSMSSVLTQNVAPLAPGNVTATASSALVVAISWSSVSGGSMYEVLRSTSVMGPYESIGMTSSTATNDTGRTGDTTYLYKVRAFAGTVPSALSAADHATTVIFTDGSLIGVVVKRVHVTELRRAVNAMRVAAGLGAPAYTDDPLAIGAIIKAAHFNELRNALDEARLDMMLPAIMYTDPTLTPGSTPVRAAHTNELRAGTQ